MDLKGLPTHLRTNTIVFNVNAYKESTGKAELNSPFSLLSFIHLILTVFLIYKHENPRTEVRTLVNVKMPLKAHGNNVTLKPI